MCVCLCIIISTHLHSLGLLNSFLLHGIYIPAMNTPKTQQQQTHKVNRPSFSILMQCQDEHYLKYDIGQCCRCFSCLVMTTMTAYVDIWVNLLLIYFQLFCVCVYAVRYTQHTHSIGKNEGRDATVLVCACVLAGRLLLLLLPGTNAHIQLQLSQTKAWTGPNEALNDLSIVCGFNTNE